MIESTGGLRDFEGVRGLSGVSVLTEGTSRVLSEDTGRNIPGFLSEGWF